MSIIMQILTNYQQNLSVTCKISLEKEKTQNNSELIELIRTEILNENEIYYDHSSLNQSIDSDIQLLLGNSIQLLENMYKKTNCFKNDFLKNLSTRI